MVLKALIVDEEDPSMMILSRNYRQQSIKILDVFYAYKGSYPDSTTFKPY